MSNQAPELSSSKPNTPTTSSSTNVQGTTKVFILSPDVLKKLGLANKIPDFSTLKSAQNVLMSTVKKKSISTNKKSAKTNDNVEIKQKVKQNSEPSKPSISQNKTSTKTLAKGTPLKKNNSPIPDKNNSKKSNSNLSKTSIEPSAPKIDLVKIFAGNQQQPKQVGTDISTPTSLKTKCSNTEKSTCTTNKNISSTPSSLRHNSSEKNVIQTTCSKLEESNENEISDDEKNTELETVPTKTIATSRSRKRKLTIQSSSDEESMKSPVRKSSRQRRLSTIHTDYVSELKLHDGSSQKISKRNRKSTDQKETDLNKNDTNDQICLPNNTEINLDEDVKDISQKECKQNNNSIKNENTDMFINKSEYNNSENLISNSSNNLLNKQIENIQKPSKKIIIHENILITPPITLEGTMTAKFKQILNNNSPIPHVQNINDDNKTDSSKNIQNTNNVDLKSIQNTEVDNINTTDLNSSNINNSEIKTDEIKIVESKIKKNIVKDLIDSEEEYFKVKTPNKTYPVKLKPKLNTVCSTEIKPINHHENNENVEITNTLAKPLLIDIGNLFPECTNTIDVPNKITLTEVKPINHHENNENFEITNTLGKPLQIDIENIFPECTNTIDVPNKITEITLTVNQTENDEVQILIVDEKISNKEESSNESDECEDNEILINLCEEPHSFDNKTKEYIQNYTISKKRENTEASESRNENLSYATISFITSPDSSPIAEKAKNIETNIKPESENINSTVIQKRESQNKNFSQLILNTSIKSPDSSPIVEKEKNIETNINHESENIKSSTVIQKGESAKKCESENKNFSQLILNTSIKSVGSSPITEKAKNIEINIQHESENINNSTILQKDEIAKKYESIKEKLSHVITQKLLNTSNISSDSSPIKEKTNIHESKNINNSTFIQKEESTKKCESRNEKLSHVTTQKLLNTSINKIPDSRPIVAKTNIHESENIKTSTVIQKGESTKKCESNNENLSQITTQKLLDTSIKSPDSILIVEKANIKGKIHESENIKTSTVIQKGESTKKCESNNENLSQITSQKLLNTSIKSPDSIPIVEKANIERNTHESKNIKTSTVIQKGESTKKCESRNKKLSTVTTQKLLNTSINKIPDSIPIVAKTNIHESENIKTSTVIQKGESTKKCESRNENLSQITTQKLLNTSIKSSDSIPIVEKANIERNIPESVIIKTSTVIKKGESTKKLESRNEKLSDLSSQKLLKTSINKIPDSIPIAEIANIKRNIHESENIQTSTVIKKGESTKKLESRNENLSHVNTQKLIFSSIPTVEKAKKIESNIILISKTENPLNFETLNASVDINSHKESKDIKSKDEEINLYKRNKKPLLVKERKIKEESISTSILNKILSKKLETVKSQISDINPKSNSLKYTSNEIQNKKKLDILHTPIDEIKSDKIVTSSRNISKRKEKNYCVKKSTVPKTSKLKQVKEENISVDNLENKEIKMENLTASTTKETSTENNELNQKLSFTPSRKEEIPENSSTVPIETDNESEINKSKNDCITPVRRRGRPPKQKDLQVLIAVNKDESTGLLNDENCSATTVDESINQEHDSSESRKYWVIPERKKGRPRKHKRDGEENEENLEDSENKSHQAKKRKLSPKPKVSKDVTCAVCNEVVKRINWPQHTVKHNFLCWQTDEPPLDLKDRKLVEYILFRSLKNCKKFFKCFTCNVCGDKKKSVLGFISHLDVCQLTDEEKEGIMVQCTECGKKLLPQSMLYHMTQHKQQKIQKPVVVVKQNDEQNTSENSQNTPRSKRKAAAKAVNLIQEVTNNEIESLNKLKKDEEYTVGRKLYVKGSNRGGSVFLNYGVILKFEQKFKQGYKKCFYPKCSFKSDDFKEIKTHLTTCSTVKNDDYICKFCLRVEKVESAMKEHVRVNHIGLDEFKSDVSESEDDDDENELDEAEEIKEKRKVVSVPKQTSEYIKPTYKVAFLAKERRRCYSKISSYYPALKWTAEFRQDNYSKELFIDILCLSSDWIPLPLKDHEEYLPRLKKSMSINTYSVSRKFPNVQQMEHEWKEYDLCESDITDDTINIFCGGPIWAFSWVPTPENVICDQYLAVSVQKDFESTYKLSESVCGKEIIQFWNCGPLQCKRKMEKPPVLEFSLAHNHGMIWYMEWCPSGYYDTQEPNDYEMLQKLGLLALACSDGHIYIYSVGKPREEEEKHKIFNAKPAYKLIFQESSEQLLGQWKYQVTRLYWSKHSYHNVIAGGFSNGMVCLWDLTIDSPLLKSEENGTINLKPYFSFQAHTSAITALVLYPLIDDGKRWLLTGSWDRSFKYWDLNNTATPFSVGKRGIVTNGVWLTHWLCSFFSFDDVFNFGHTITTVQNPRDFAFKQCSALASNSVVMSLSSSDWASAIAQGSLAGELTGSFPRTILMSYDVDKTLKCKRMMFSYNEIIDKTAEISERKDIMKVERKSVKLFIDKDDKTFTKYLDSQELEPYVEEPTTYEGAMKKFGLVFCDLNMEKFTAIPEESFEIVKQSNRLREVPTELYPITSLNTVTWNPNKQAYLYLASGYQNGFARIRCVRFMNTQK